MRIKFKPLAIIIGVLLLLVILQSILVMTGVFNKLVRERLEGFLSESLNGSCHITDIRGRWNYFSLSGIEIRSEGLDADVKKGEIELDIPSLLFKRISVNRLYLDSVSVNIKKKAESGGEEKPDALQKDVIEAIKSFPFSVRAGEVTLNNIDVIYDTLYAKGVNLNAVVSFNRKKGYLIYRIENCDLSGWLNLAGSEGEIKLISDSLSHEGTLKCRFFDFENSIGYKKENLYINRAFFKFHADGERILRESATVKGSAEISGIYGESEKSLKIKAEFSKVGVDSFTLDGIYVSARLDGDTLSLREMECRDKDFLMRANGFAELSPSLGGEFNLLLERVSANPFVKGRKLEENSISGLLHLKTDFKKSTTVILDSLRGEYGNVKNISLSGGVSFIDGEASLNGVTLNVEDGKLELSGSMGGRKGNASVKLVNFPMEVFSALKNDLNLSGQLNGELRLSGGTENYRLDYNLEMTNGFFEKNEFEYAGSSGFVNGRKNEILGGIIQGSFVNGMLFGRRVSIVYFESKKENEMLYADIDGVTDLFSFGASARMSLEGGFSSGKGVLSRFDVRTGIDVFSLDNDVKVEFGRDLLIIDSLSLSAKNAYLRGNVMLHADSLIFALDGYDKNLAMTGYFTGIDIKGDGKVKAEGHGFKDSLIMKLNGSVKDAEIAGIKVDSVFLNCDYDGYNLDVNYLNAYHEESLSYLFGRIMVDRDSIKNSMMEMSFNIRHVDGGFFLPLENVFTVKAADGLKGEGRIFGKVSEPRMEGEIRVDSAEVYIASLGTTVKAVKGYAVLTGDSAIVRELRGKTERGNLLLNGGVSLDKYMMEEYWFKILADGAHSTGIDYVDVFANCSLDIRGDMKKVDMNGLIKITEGVSNFPFIASSDNQQSSGGESDYQSNMSLHFANDNNLWLKNSFVDAELKGDVYMRKSGSKWNITGKANVIRGYYFYLDKKFKITNGVFDLKQTSKIVEPEISISSNTRIQYVDGDEKKQADVYLEATGSAFKPTVSLYSDPPLGIENIISILSFNTTVSSLNNFEEISKGVPEKALQIYLRNKYLNTISSSIGVDQLDIQTNLLGTEKSAKLSVGKYIGKRLYVSYTHDVFTFENDIFRIEYNILKNTDIVSERDEQGYFNTGIQFKYRF